jgi:hypothetical protein
MVDAIAGSEDGEDAWEFADGSPEVAVGMLQKQVGWEEWNLNAMPERADDVIATADGGQGEVGLEAGADEICIGPTFCLAVGLDDAPIAAARRVVPSVERVRLCDG